MTLMEIIIKIDNKSIFFNSTTSIPVRNSNLPMDYMTFKFHIDHFWRVELIHYSEDNKCWKVKVLDHSIINTDTFKTQKPTRPIEKIEFEKLDWNMLEPQLSSYQEINLRDSLYNHNVSSKQKSKTYQQDEVFFNNSMYKIPDEIPISNPKSGVDRRHIPKKPWIDCINVNFSFKFQEATFIEGSVTNLILKLRIVAF
jgi:hypothetical protein